MRYLTYQDLRRMLGIAPATAYRWFPARKGGEIATGEVLRALNANRHNGQPPLSDLPDRLYRPHELAEWTASHMAKPRTEVTIRAWADDAPHFKLGKLNFYDAPTIRAWLDAPRNPRRESTLLKPKGN